MQRKFSDNFSTFISGKIPCPSRIFLTKTPKISVFVHITFLNFEKKYKSCLWRLLSFLDEVYVSRLVKSWYFSMF
jgi:hypothetical protein